MPEQSRNNIYALERDLYHGQFCYENDPNFTFEDSDTFSHNNGPSVMREMTQCNIPDVTFSRNCQQMSKLNTNRYATKKTIAQGMLDIALLSSNASQLKYILSVGEEHEYYMPMLVLIISSIVLQVSFYRMLGNRKEMFCNVSRNFFLYDFGSGFKWSSPSTDGSTKS